MVSETGYLVVKNCACAHESMQTGQRPWKLPSLPPRALERVGVSARHRSVFVRQDRRQRVRPALARVTLAAGPVLLPSPHIRHPACWLLSDARSDRQAHKARCEYVSAQIRNSRYATLPREDRDACNSRASLIFCFRLFQCAMNRLRVAAVCCVFITEIAMNPSHSLAFLAISLLLSGNLLAHDNSRVHLAQMSAAKKEQAQEYFRAHSFGFTTLFKRYHPGPYWILKNRRTLHLTAGQMKQEQRLKDAMAARTIAEDGDLHKMYNEYARAAAIATPDLTTMNDDITRIGKAQTRLALEMVPYHLDSYSVLSREQKVIYARLAARTWKRHKHNDQKRQ